MSELTTKEEKTITNSPPTSTTIAAFQQYSGPIPPPQFLAEYEKLSSGSAKRFLDEPHIEAEHRRSLERQALEANIKLASRGQVLAFIIACFGIVVTFCAILSGHSIIGVGLFLVSIASLTGSFFLLKKKSAQPKNQKIVS